MTEKYIRLANLLRDLIASNTKSGIHKLPSEAQLSKQYGISRETVRRALALLTEEGLIETRKGSGSYATGLADDSNLNRIAIMLPCENEYIYPSVINDIQTTLNQRGYSSVIYQTENNVSTEREILKELIRNPVRGLIVEGCKSALPNPNLDLYERLRHAGTSIVFLHNYYAALSDYIHITDDNYYGGYLLGKHLIEQNHTKIAGLFKSDDMQGPERYSGLVSAIRDSSLPIPDKHIAWFGTEELKDLDKKQDTGFLLEFIRKQLKSCTAVICYNDEIAYWLIKELQYANLRVPEDIAVACFDNSYLSELSAVRITSLSHQPHEMGYAAANTLLKMMQGLPVKSLKTSWHLVSKESDAPL